MKQKAWHNLQNSFNETTPNFSYTTQITQIPGQELHMAHSMLEHNINEINTLDEYNYEQLIEFVDDRPGHDIRYAINNDKINTLGWKPYYSWEEGLRETVDWYISKPEYFNVKTKKSYSGERLGKL